MEDLLSGIRREMHERLEELRSAVDEPGLMVSSKVARLMHAPRRPTLERSGIARVSEGVGSPRCGPRCQRTPSVLG
jgi:hypothetical protein